MALAKLLKKELPVIEKHLHIGYAKWDDLVARVEEHEIDNIIKNNIITIKCVSEYGEVDGITYLKKEDISSILCDSEDEVVLKILSENVLSPNNHW